MLTPKLEKEIKKLAEVYPEKQTAILPALYLVQEDFGYLPENELADIAEIIGLSPTEAYNIATYYTYFYVKKPTGKNIIRICDSVSCYLNDNDQVRRALEKELKIKVGKTTKDKLFSLEVVECLGACAKAPAMTINGDLFERVEPDQVKNIINSYQEKEGAKK